MREAPVTQLAGAFCTFGRVEWKSQNRYHNLAGKPTDTGELVESVTDELNAVISELKEISQELQWQRSIEKVIRIIVNSI